MSNEGAFSELSIRQPLPAFVEATVDASELALFSRDLGGTLTDVLVAAAGRALAAQAGTRAGGSRAGVGVAVSTVGGQVIPVVRNAATAPLPEVRSEVERLVGAARSGQLVADDLGNAALIVDHVELGSGDLLRAGTSSDCRVLAVGTLSDNDTAPTLTLLVAAQAAEGEAADRLLASLVALLERPYRRLV
jgi:2-oxoacid dehydrogenases acyltransferase (catalytic domain)